MEIPTLLKASEVAEILQVSPRTLASWRANYPDQLPFIRLGDKTIRYHREALEDYIGQENLDDDYDDNFEV